MEHLPISSEQFRYALHAYKDWLATLGYANHNVYVMPQHVREMLHYMELQGISRLDEIQIRDIRLYYDYLRHRDNTKTEGTLGSNSLNKHQFALRKFMDYLRQSGRLILPEIKLRSEEQEESRIEVLAITEIKALYEAAASEERPRDLKFTAREQAMLTIYYGCGLRRNEGVRLDVDDINLQRGFIHVRHGKGYTERFVPLSQKNRTYLGNYLEQSRPKFRNANSSDAFFLSE